MADITIGTGTTDSGSTTPVSGVLTFAATLGATTDFLAVTAHARDDTVSGVTWNGVAMTKQVEKAASNGLYASIWTLAAPATGTHNVVITAVSTGPTYLAGSVIPLVTVMQTAFSDDTDSLETNGANPALTGLTTVTDKTAVIDAFSSNSTVLASMNAETNRVSRSNFLEANQGRAVGSSTIITKSPAGAVTMGWDIGANNSAYVALAVKPAATATLSLPWLPVTRVIAGASSQVIASGFIPPSRLG